MNFGHFIQAIDWFIPEATKSERIELTVARNFVFTHIAGPLLAQSISVFLYMTDPHPGFACWMMIVCIWGFLLLPPALKIFGKLAPVAVVSVELLSFAALFGAFFYGGVSSPFLPWLLVSLLLGFFYLADRPLMVMGLFVGNIGAFALAYFLFGFQELVPASQLSTVGWISILSAIVYMSWMAIFYANIMSMRSELEREGERHRGHRDSARPSQGTGRCGESRQIDLPVEDEPRVSHSSQRRDRLQRDPARGR